MGSDFDDFDVDEDEFDARWESAEPVQIVAFSWLADDLHANGPIAVVAPPMTSNPGASSILRDWYNKILTGAGPGKGEKAVLAR